MKAKVYILIILSINLIGYAHAQCNCEKITRDDGTKVTACPTLQISYDKEISIGISAASNGYERFVTVNIRFSSFAHGFSESDDLLIRLESNNLLSLPLSVQQKSYFGGSEVTQAMFVMTTEQLIKLVESDIKTISFKLADDNHGQRIYKVLSNKSLVAKQLACI